MKTAIGHSGSLNNASVQNMSATAINVENSSQLLALLDHAAAGPRGNMIISTSSKNQGSSDSARSSGQKNLRNNSLSGNSVGTDPARSAALKGPRGN